MKRQAALQRILILWLLAAAFLALFAIAQVIAGKYGDDATIPLNWISAQIVPVLGLLLAATFSSPTQAWKEKVVTQNRYALALVTSILQIGAIILVLLIEPVLTTSSFDLFDQTIFYFSIWQGVVTGCVGGLVFDGR